LFYNVIIKIYSPRRDVDVNYPDTHKRWNQKAGAALQAPDDACRAAGIAGHAQRAMHEEFQRCRREKFEEIILY